MKVRTKQVHPLVAQAMSKAATPPVLATGGLVILGVWVLAWIVAGWAGVIAFPLAVAAVGFLGAVAWRRSGIAKKTATARQGARQAQGQGGRGGLLTRMALRRARAAATDARGGGMAGARPGGGGGYRGAHRSGGGLLGRMLNRGRSGGVSAAHSGGHAGARPMSGGSEGGARKGAFGRLASKLKGRQRGVGGGVGHAGSQANGHGSRSAGTTGKRGLLGGLRGVAQRAHARRQATETRPGVGRGQWGFRVGPRASAGTIGAKGRAASKGTASGPTDASSNRPGFFRRVAGDLRRGFQQTAGVATKAGKPPLAPVKHQNAPAGRHGAAAQRGRRPATKPSDTYGAVDLLERGVCAQCGGPILKGEFAYPTKSGGLICPGCSLGPHFRRPVKPAPPANALNEGRRAAAERSVSNTQAPQHGVRNGRDTSMSNISSREDASLQGWGRSLNKVSPVIDEVASSMTPIDDALGGIAKALRNMTNVGRDDIPADAGLVAEVEGVAAEAEQIRGEYEALLARTRGLSTRAEALPPMYANRHETDEGRLNGERGGLQREKRADVGYAQQDT